MHFGVGIYRSKPEKFIKYLYIQPMKSFQTVRPLCSNIDNGPTSLPKHRNDPKFSDRDAWANSADPDQTAPRGGAV